MINPRFSLSTLLFVFIGGYFIYAAYSKILDPADLFRPATEPVATENATPADPTASTAPQASSTPTAGPAAFARSINNYKILPASLVNIAAVYLPWLELVCGLALIFVPPLRGAASLLTILMLLVFIGAIGWALQQGLDISCGCTSSDPNAAKIGIHNLLRNGLMIAALFYALAAARSEGAQT